MLELGNGLQCSESSKQFTLTCTPPPMFPVILYLYFNYIITVGFPLKNSKWKLDVSTQQLQQGQQQKRGGRGGGYHTQGLGDDTNYISY